MTAEVLPGIMITEMCCLMCQAAISESSMYLSVIILDNSDTLQISGTLTTITLPDERNEELLVSIQSGINIFSTLDVLSIFHYPIIIHKVRRIELLGLDLVNY